VLSEDRCQDGRKARDRRSDGLRTVSAAALTSRQDDRAASGPRRIRARLRRGVACLAPVALLVLQGCMVGPDYVAPETEMPDRWNQELSEGLTEGKADLRTWWTNLDDPTLDRLIERATLGNLDIKQAVARIRQARAAFGIATGEIAPTVDAEGQIQNSRVSNNVSGVAPPQSRTDTFYSFGLDSSGEIDLWGRIRRNIESADASIGASIEDYRDVLVVLYAEVADTYVQIRTLQSRIVSALGNVKTQEGALQLTINRNRAGLAPDLDVRQAQLNLATTQAFVPTLLAALAQNINRLAVLLGEYPSAVQAELTQNAPIPSPPPQVITGLPTELLRQRPDIRQAERELASQTAQIGVATAALYPTLSLSGAFAFESFSASDLLQWKSRAFQFGPTVRWNIFDAGRIRSNILVQDALTEELLAGYEQTVLSAVEEVESAMAAYVQEVHRREALQRSVVAARASVSLVDTLYRSGLTDFQNVLDTQRSQFEQEDALAESRGLVTQYLIQVYQALGGGWGPEPEQAPAPAVTSTEPPSTPLPAPPRPTV
jgi:NodT family efflux transporter outer membrane factor (OMF) lipoprotein